MKRLFLGNISKTLTILVSLAIVPAMLIILYSGIEHRRDTVEAVEREVLFLAESLGQIQKGYFSATHQMMAALSRTNEVRSFQGEAASQQFQV